ncbi:hypothetical protein BsWGS_15740 [Bradybaena similaris]
MARSEVRTAVFKEQGPVIIGRSYYRSLPKPLTYDILKTWVDMEDAGQLVLLMSSESERRQLEKLLNQPKMNEQMLDLLVDAVNHAITAQHQKESIRQLLGTLCRTKFMEHLTDYLNDKEITKPTWNNATHFFTLYLHILKEILDKLPQYVDICVSKALELSRSACVFESLKNNEPFLKDITEFSERAKEIFRIQINKERRSRGQYVQSNNLEEPPDSFVDLPVVPTISDLQENTKPFIRCVQTEGGYKDINHYLDVQFRLMREDFILPLREAIIQFKQNGCEKSFSSSEVMFYYDVKIIGTVISERIDHFLQFNVSAWQVLKRLIFGSLLCLSKDNFESVLFATVTQCDEENLAKGIITVNFKTGLDDVFNSTSSDVYILAETSAYFESYCHVLEGLQEMVTKLPLQDYIIHCKTELKPPRYLFSSGRARGVPKYDLSCLMENDITCKVPVLTTVKWPKAEVMCLNESQRAAAQLALTKELAIIQGPPGTGKTYVGLKVMQVLLENKHIMAESGRKNRDPILVVCYTNHALDQFLEGVLKFCPDGIVRVGGKSKSTKLDRFNLTNLKQKRSVLNSCLKQSVKECIVEMETISTQISKLNTIMESLHTNIINEKVLEGFVKKSHYDSLVSARKQLKNVGQINAWLKTDNSTARSVVPQMIKRHLCTLVLELETTSLGINLSKEMNIIERATFYHFYLNKYTDNLKKEIDLMSKQIQSRETAKRIKDIEYCLKDARRKILADEEMSQVLPKVLLKKMSKYLTSDDRPFVVPENAVVESWLLGLNKDLQSQLDDVEFIMNHNTQEVENDVYFDEDDDYKKEQNDRMVDDDDVNVDKYNEGLRTALNTMTCVIQRAHSLGISDDIFTEEEVGMGEWKTQVKSLNLRKVFDKLRLIKPMTEENENNVTNVWDLDLNERFALYNLWIRRYKETLTQKMQELVNNYKSLQEKKAQVNREKTLRVLRKANVIGMTTSGAARHRAVLQALGCRIIVVEEAAEVLESHIVTSLNKNCKHLILIGDHQQLRPKTTVYQLARDFGLEISLFERLIKNRVPHELLTKQHRMRPEISQIIRHIYPDLEDDQSVTNYEKIRGVSKNIFFIQHEYKETHLEATMSKANTHEAKFLVALSQFLLNQGYEASQITILATYAGQVTEIRKRLDMSLGICLTTVDNFQGEENDIILLSLVRSNTENQTGFLKVDNRVCVALSRAKKGLYAIGNFNLLASQSKLWSKIVNTANEEHIIDIGLPVICERHPDIQRLIINADDFKKCPEGGCGQPCNFVLKCGHTCGLSCHGYDAEHLKYKCMKTCSRKCEVGHPCRKSCFEVCGKCSVLVMKEFPICGHENQVPCSVPPEEAICKQRCSHILQCQHQCSGRCGQCRKQREHNICSAPVPYQWECGHAGSVPCHSNPPLYPCKQLCGAQLQCGHICQGTCLECLRGAVHVACEDYCEKQLPCGHPCTGYCGVPCMPCEEKCPFECSHGACSRQDPCPPCSHACEPCMEECSHKCKHGKCSKKCSEFCDTKCKKLCYRDVDCKTKHHTQHKCNGMCGELCVTRECNKILEVWSSAEKGEAQKGACAGALKHPVGGESSGTDAAMTETVNTESQEKKGRLLKIASCGHIFLVNDLDNYVYGFGTQGSSYIPCPSCKKPILKCRRYEDINKARSANREFEKRKLLIQSSISVKQKEDLLKSQKQLEKSSMLTEFHSLNVEEVKTVMELQALSFQFKCAFLLNTIFSIKGTEHAPSSLELLKSRKEAVLKIPRRLTNQQKAEFVTEMSRCLWLLFLSHLASLPASKVVNDSTKCGIDDKVCMIIQELSKPKPDNNLLQRAEHISIELSRIMQRMSKVAEADLKKLEETILCAIKVLRSRDDKMLCHLLDERAKGDNIKSEVKSGRPESEAQTLAIKSDAPESEEWTSVAKPQRKSAAAKKQCQQQQNPSKTERQESARGSNPMITKRQESTKPSIPSSTQAKSGPHKGNKQEQYHGAKEKKKKQFQS